MRITLPLMSQHNIPATPQNYAVWYQYSTGANTKLKTRIDELRQDQTPFSERINEQLYNEYTSECNITELLRIRGEIGKIIEDAGDSLSSSESATNHFGASLQGLSNAVEEHPQLSALNNLLEPVLQETREMQASAQQIAKDFAEKSQEISRLQEELSEARKIAHRDALTGLANRSRFFSDLEDAIEAFPEANDDLCLLMLDIDHFKRVNDTYGHLLGDKVIRYTANILTNSVKGKDTAARFGGEEFVVVLPETTFEGARKLAETIRKTLADARLVRSGTRESIGQITISIGLSRYRQGEDPQDLIERADRALYLSKNKGRNRVTDETALD